jgi:RHS repeat-associated protein
MKRLDILGGHVVLVVALLFQSVGIPLGESITAKAAGITAPEEEGTPAPAFTVAVSPSPTDTPFPTLTATSWLTDTPTVAVSLSPTETPTPTQLPPPETPPMGEGMAYTLTLSAEPLFITPGGMVTLFWEISGWDGAGEGYELLFTLPEGFTPHGHVDGDFDPQTNTLFVLLADLPPGQRTQGNQQWAVDETAIGPFTLSAELRQVGLNLAKASLTLTADHFIIPPGGGEANGSNGKVRVIFPAGAFTETLSVYVGAPGEGTAPPESLSGGPFEIAAFEQDSGLAVNQFQQPITIEVSYDEGKWGRREGSLLLYYYDETEGYWRSLPTTVDGEANLLRAESDHLTVFDVNAEDWQAARLPDLSAFQVSQFSGAASYSYPLWVPPGPGGLQPNLVLSYSSQSVDSASVQTQASWVGMGWSLEVGAIERDMHGTMDTTVDDTFNLSVGGVSSLLLKDDSNNYHTADETFWKVQYDELNDSWKVWDKSGTLYIFGDTDGTRARFPDYWGPTNCDSHSNDAVMRTWRWGLSKIHTIFSQELTLTFSYYKHTERKDNPHCEGEQKLHDTDVALYPDTITYPHGHYQIKFIRQERHDYDSSWTRADRRIFYEKYALNEVEIYRDSQVIRVYDLMYMGEGGGTNYIFPGYIWSEGDPALTLAKIEEYGVGRTNHLPATTFTYEDDLHLTHVDNGYGGVIRFEYDDTPWYELQALEEQIFDEPGGFCDRNDYDYGGWDGNRLSCLDGKLVVYGTAYYDDVPDGLFQPGGAYKQLMRVRAKDVPGSVTVTIGIDYGTGTQWTTYPNVTDWITATQYITLPGNATKIEMYISCNSGDCKVNQPVELHLLSTHYRVATKTLHDDVTGQESVFEYRYDEPATNDAAHSQAVADYLATPTPTPTLSLYTDQYAEFRGHAMAQEIGPDGRVTTTFFHQDDARKGSAHTTLVMTQAYSTTFEAFETNAWYYSDDYTHQFIERLAGDQALKTYNAVADWNSEVRRLTDSLTDGEVALVSFRVAAGTQETVLMVEDGTRQTPDYRRWGIHIYNDRSADVEINNLGGLNWVRKDLVDAAGLQNDRWYVLLLGIDDRQFYLRLWQRDEPANAWDYRCNMTTDCSQMSGKDWRFRQNVYQGTVWLDSYSEGRLYSLSQMYYEALPQSTNRVLGGESYADLDIVWTRLDGERSYNFGGDAEYVGRMGEYVYDESEQGGTQYGNRTRVIESYWDGDSWMGYRASRSRFYPTVDISNDKYLVGLPANYNQFKCESGVCDLGTEDLLASTWYLYDGEDTFNVAPTTGVLTGQRTLLCLADDNNVCYDEYNANYTRLLFNDELYEYDSWGNRVRVKQYTGIGWWVKSNGQSMLASGEERITTTTYDSTYHTYATAVTNALNQTITLIYDYDKGVPLSETDPNNATTTATYDDFGRLLTLRRPYDESPNRATISITYNDTTPFWTEIQQKIGESNYTRYRKFYNGLGQLIQSQIGSAEIGGVARDVIVDYWYDDYGRVIRQSVPYDVTTGSVYSTRDESRANTRTDYDILGRTAVITATDGTEQHYGYNDLQVWVTDPRNPDWKTYTDFDVWGRTIRVEAPAGPAIEYGYDPLDQLTVVTQTATITTSLTYDLAGRKTEMSDPDMGHWSYTYDALGNLLTQKDARCDQSGNCVTISFIYDDSNRLTQKSYTIPGGLNVATTSTVNYYYDEGGAAAFALGRRTSMTDSSGSTVWEYDQRGRVMKETKAITGSGTFVTQWSYKSNDALAWVKYPGGNGGQIGEYLTYGYTSQGLLKSLSGNSNYVQNVLYDAAGRIELRTLGNDVLRTDYTYFGWNIINGQGRLKRITVGTSSDPTSLLDLRYYSGADTPKYDAIGNLLNIYDYKMGSPQTQTFTYDALNRLISGAATGGTNGLYDEGYSYDPATGNLASKTGMGAYTYDATHKHAVAYTSSGWSYQYDANGNMTRRDPPGSDYYDFVYDAENRITQAKKNGTVIAAFVYDGDGNRVKATVNGVTTSFVGTYFEWTNGQMTKYYYAAGQRIAMRDNGTLYYLFGDHLGSTSVSYRASDGQTTRQLYKPWGEPRYASGSLPTDYTYTGQYSHVSDFGLLFFVARWYDPALGRFAQADTIVPGAGNPQAFNRYSYAIGNPLRYNDPSGHWFESLLDVASIAYDIYDISKNGLNWSNGLSLAADVASLALPAVTGGGLLVRAMTKADDVTDAARAVNAAANVAQVASQADNAADALKFAGKAADDVADAGRDLIRVVPLDDVGTSKAFKTRKGEDGLSVFQGVSPDEVLAELPGYRSPNTTVTIPAEGLPSGTEVISTPAPTLSQRLSDAHRILVRPMGWSVDRFARTIKALVGWE